MTYYEGETFAEVYPALCGEVLSGARSGPRGLMTLDAGSVHFKLFDGEDWGLFRSQVRSTNLRYFAAECLWYFSGDTSVEWIGRFAKLWNRIANKDGNVQSNYGHRIWHRQGPDNMIEWHWCLSKIINDPDTRQAVIPIHARSDHAADSKDIPCTMSLGFRTEPGTMKGQREVNIHVTMRSSDIHFGLPYDVPFFKLLQRLLCVHLNSMQTANEYVPGYYEHHSYSLHAYEKDWKTMEALQRVPVHKVAGLPSLDPPPVHPLGGMRDTSPFIKWAEARTSLGGDQP